MKHGDVCKAFGNEVRLKLIVCLGKPKSVSEMLCECTLAQSALSQHLRVLRDAGVVTARKEGREVVYHVASARIHDLAKQLLSLTRTQ